MMWHVAGHLPPHCVFIYVFRALNLQYMRNLIRGGAIKHRGAGIEFVQRIQENNKSQGQKAT
jgi:hypothetical protein